MVTSTRLQTIYPMWYQDDKQFQVYKQRFWEILWNFSPYPITVGVEFCMRCSKDFWDYFYEK